MFTYFLQIHIKMRQGGGVVNMWFEVVEQPEKMFCLRFQSSQHNPRLFKNLKYWFA